MGSRPIRVLVADDFEPFRRFISRILGSRPTVQIVCEVSDGLEAARQAEELQPDVILLDIGLPKLNGIEAARRILSVSPKSKILFVSMVSSADVVQEALATGAKGYIVKTDAGSELLPGLFAILRDERFVSSSLTDHDSAESSDEAIRRDHFSSESQPQDTDTVGRHEVCFYADDATIVDHAVQFLEPILRAGDAVIVVATESHRSSILQGLQSYGLDMAEAVEQGRYMALDAASTISSFIVDNGFDQVRFIDTFGTLIVTAETAANTEDRRVAVFGEGAHVLCSQGKVEAAIQDEELCNQLIKRYKVDILCGYSLGIVQGEMDGQILERICAEHSVVYSE